MAKLEKSIIMKVLEAYTRDVGRGVIRMDYDSMDKLNLSTGDPVLLTSEKKNAITSEQKKTASKVLPLYPSDEGKGLVRLDGLGRSNLDIAVGDPIKIEKTQKKNAEQIIVYPLQSIPELDLQYFADALESVPVLKGDKFALPYFGGRLNFKVVDTKPDGVVYITLKTEFIIDEEDLPDELKEFEEHILQRRQKLLKGIKDEILINLKEKKYENLKNIIQTYTTEIQNLTDMKKQIRKILAEERDLGKGIGKT